MRLFVVVVVGACSFDRGLPPSMHPDDATDSDDGLHADAMNDAQLIDAMVDARVCPAAPPTCTLFTCASSSSCYYICGSATAGKQNYNGAKGTCASNNVGCVVTINSQMENDCIALVTQPSFPNALVWFGFQQATNGSEPGGGWSWACGTSGFVAPNWGDFEPNNTNNNEDCAAMTAAGVWLDVDCGGTARFVCELP